MAAPRYRSDFSQLLRVCILLGVLWKIRAEQIHYSVPEELEKGSFVGNVTKDLGLEPRELAERGVRIVSRGRTQLFALNPRSGSLVTAGRIDREELCDRSPKCVVSLEILLEDKVKIFGIEVDIIDVNDNAPNFGTEQREIKITENEIPGTRFPLPEAFDPDVGVNSLQGYQLSSNGHFSLDVQSGADGSKYPELVLERALDREKEADHHLVLTAFDGGDPVHSSTARIHITLVDTNDNAPIFTQPEYYVSVPENVPVGYRLLTIKATDPDEGANGEVTYSLRKVRDKISQLFQLNSLTGDITLLGNLDYEDSGFYDIDVEAHDGPGLRARSKVLVTVLDVNDNAPEVTVTSLTSSIQEGSSPGTVIALFNVHDSDSGENGLVTCSFPDNQPFTLEKTYGNYHRLLTQRTLDREEVSEYNITVTATDHGTPPLSTETHISLHVVDINDNPPAFPHASYSAYIPENNPRGASILSMIAQDPDSMENARVTYSLAEDTLQGVPLSSYISINSDTGVLYALNSFDYEQIRDLQLLVTASDSGDPPLSSNVSLSLFILDQNDNAPEILYPALPTDGSTGVELAPRSAEPGYLVTKVVAVDRDSGQNAWLSYRLLKASEPGLFSVGLHTGEVRTARALLDRDALKQSLVVVVQDHGHPRLSATVTLTVAVANSIPDVLADLGSISTPADSEDSDLTLYLVVAVAVVSCVFLAFVILLMALRLRRWHMSRLLRASEGGLAGVPVSNFVGVDGVRAFLQTYSHEVSLTADSRKSHLIFPQPNYADTLISQESCEKSEPLLITQDFPETKGDPSLHQPNYADTLISQESCEKSEPLLIPEKINANEELGVVQQAPPNTDWRFSQAQRPGTSGSQNGDETGTWPNNQFDTEMLQAMILASASEAADGSSTLGGGAGTMGLSARYGPQFTLQHVPDYRQNVYIPGSNATLTNAAGKRDGKAPAGGNGNKKKSGKKEKK
ncbi:protocadherin gamma-A4 isoform X1 [Talpa occidentalis]|uniref:protocadherin gamma-A4 isoform X1 n=1 Tax=Talpa occidentalis TaxID=50954 RepID=UPI0023F98E28|nr:protocadherin gamma-A4 isoform X1 [Talpa occidentalis]